LAILLLIKIAWFHRIDGDKVGGYRVVLGDFNTRENSTKALKNMLCDLKWVLYWFSGTRSFALPLGIIARADLRFPDCSFGWWLVLICSERKILLADCWWLICSERKVLLAGG
jgi:hypothetical protein